MRVLTGCKQCLAGLLMLVGLVATVSAEDVVPVAGKLEDLKKQVIELNRDLSILEEDLLFPASTQVAVFLSLNTGKFLRLDSVKLKIDGEIVAAHLYTDTQIRALQRGGMQRLYTGNLKTGPHELTAFVEGLGPDNREYKKAVSLGITKANNLKSMEIRIQDVTADYQPDLRILEWE